MTPDGRARATLADARARLEAAIRQGGEGDPAAGPDTGVLAERAILLARPATDPREDRRDETKMIAFRLGDLRCAIPLASLREVLPLRHVTPLPGMPAYVLGARGVRGEVLTVVALGPLFGHPPPAAEQEEARMLVVEVLGAPVALAVDAVEGVQTVAVDGLKPPVSTALGTYERHVLGLCPDLAYVLDIAGLLGESSIIIDLPS